MYEKLLQKCHTIYTWINLGCEFVNFDFKVWLLSLNVMTCNQICVEQYQVIPKINFANKKLCVNSDLSEI